ncbi:MAG: hypothetical protein WBI07_19900 [Mobilitalea sp.]
MQEPEVSLLIAIYYIENHLTNQDIYVSIDGAHIKTIDTVHFDIAGFMLEHNCRKSVGLMDKWQGFYTLQGYEARIIVHSQSGVGDVNIKLESGKEMYIESKKSRDDNKNGAEYPLMREAIGQLMTGGELKENIIPAVAVPFSKKSLQLAKKWSEYSQINQIGLKFILVKDDGNIVFI